MPHGKDLDIHVVTAQGAYDIRDVIYGGRPARVLYSSATHTAQSGVARDDGPDMLFDYMERFMELVRGLLPTSILLIGGGAFALPTAILEELPNVSLTIVEIDRELASLAQQYFDFVPGQQTKVVATDGLTFLRTDATKYDLVLLDVFAEASIPTEFQTIDTARLLYEHVSHKGMLAMNIIAAYHGPRSAVLRRQIAAWQAAFTHLQLFPAGHDESLWFPQNFILTAQTRDQDVSDCLRYPPLSVPRT